MIPPDYYPKYMLKALSIAKSVKGYTSPNPAVGAVLVHNHHIISSGATQKYGQPHAEVVAIQKIQPIPPNTHLYVTLEPCCIFSKTPPCTQIIIQNKIHSVFIGSLDPNPKIHGKSIPILQNAGIHVHVGFLKHQIQTLNEDFAKFIQFHIPFCTAKYAMTLDGKIATNSFQSKWISNPSSRQIVQKIRTQSDSILVGVNTIIYDNPKLTIRIPTKNQSKTITRVILDPHAKTPTHSHVLIDQFPSLFVLNQYPHSPQKSKLLKLCQKYRKSILFQEQFNSQNPPKNHIPLKPLFQKLASLNITSILLESGPSLLFHALHQKLIDKIICFISPKILSGIALSPFTPHSKNFQQQYSLSQAFPLKKISSFHIHDDIIITGYLVQ